ncbi:hypothetical protein PHYC_02981 [Phycisphaerales bacterium]|nr:hypothetical protein PHYC_02981 [Phycisphaerales bacterium]
MKEVLFVMALVLVIGVPFTLWWRKLGDKWANKEHGRSAAAKGDTRERVVVRAPDSKSDGGGT